MKLIVNFILFLFIFQTFVIPASAQDTKIQPESSTGYEEKGAVSGKEIMIVTANPIATEAGYDVLESGGTAADAVFAAQLVLGLVEPQSSGLGGGGFALYWDAAEEQLYTYDGRETAPASIQEDVFLNADGEPMDFYEASIGGRAVGIPGIPKLLDTLYTKHGGKVSRDIIFEPAMQLAEYGFFASPRLAALIEANKPHFRYFQSTKDYFTPNGAPIELGSNIKNDEYLSVLKSFKEGGDSIFYTGEIGKNIQEAVNGAWYNPGNISDDDLAQYKVIERPAVCGIYRVYKVCSMGEPSSGGLTLIQALQLLDRFDLETHSPNSPQAWHLIAEASRLAFADRVKYMADPDFMQTPGTSLLNPAYVAVRSSMIDPGKAMENVEAGIPLNWDNQALGVDKSVEKPGTTHIVAVDKYGNTVSMTSTIETAFGSKLMVDGFLLNNQLTDFSFLPSDKNGNPIANKVEGGKRPRSSMSPVIVFDINDRPILLIGSAGGSRIIGYTLQRIISILDWGIAVDNALSMPHILTIGNSIEIEEGFEDFINTSIFEKYGHKVKVKELNSGLTAAYFLDDHWVGAADPRREGMAQGR